MKTFEFKLKVTQWNQTGNIVMLFGPLRIQGLSGREAFNEIQHMRHHLGGRWEVVEWKEV